MTIINVLFNILSQVHFKKKEKKVDKNIIFLYVFVSLSTWF